MPLINNYGGILQAYALKTVIEQWGHEVFFIERDRWIYVPWFKLCILYCYRFVKKYIFKKPFVIIHYEKEMNRAIQDESITQKNIAPFILQHFKFRKVKAYTELSEDEFQAIIVGSDQVWRHYYSRTIMGGTPSVFLDFARGWQIKRIAYAASFGVEWWEMDDKLTHYCSELISLFDAVSVREEEGVNLCRDYLNYSKAIHVLDPTLLLGRDYYESLIPSYCEKSKGNLLCYILDENLAKERIIKQVADNYRLIPFRANSKVEDGNADLSERIQPSIESWLRGFTDADFVVTDSFHACVFSIIFEKPFLVFVNKQRGASRIKSLLRLFHLEDRMVYEDESGCIPSQIMKIDFSDYYVFRKKSLDFLNKSLNKSLKE